VARARRLKAELHTHFVSVAAVWSPAFRRQTDTRSKRVLNYQAGLDIQGQNGLKPGLRTSTEGLDA
jgi:hypothetical protein